MVKKMWQSISKNAKIIYIALALLITVLVLSNLNDKTELIDQKRAMQFIESAKLEKVLVKRPYVYLYLEDATYKVPKEAMDLEKLFTQGLVEYHEDSSENMETLIFLLLLAMIIYIFYSIRTSRQVQEKMLLREQEENVQVGNEMQYIKAQHSLVNFADVAGVEGVKEELKEIIDFLKNPQKYREFDISLPKGVLLVGPPGVGKTLIAKAVAGEADVPFFYQSAASFVQIYVGMGAKRVSELFARAKETAPSIIFIDEIDAVGKSRGGQNNEEREATLNQLLTEMDGFEESSGVMVLAATNKIDVLDDALLRAGRFDRRVHIGLPDFEERTATIRLYLQSKRHNVDIEKISRLTIGFNSAALATLINEAALYALRLNKFKIEDEDVEAVREKVLLGKFKIQNFSEHERRIQALYQAAKAITASWLEVEFEKIGILSSHFVPHHNEILSKTVLENELKVLLAGRIATKNHYAELFSNAKDDIKTAKLLARQITEEFFMTEGYSSSPNHSDQILLDATDEVETLLSKLDAVLVIVKEYLLDNESITMEQTKVLINEVF
ncbi:MAG: Cell division protein FtsH (EC [uncultured Sulfurovum sp.]|uniref:Cell division protein FtsH (EC) n=1 Tax=uncultured Sulfurovum sp. TaxID=269237 RepID=A0A6S6T1C0_9BACT|nr:MAG: Cell division protein FtsH (EC [uncultured Sulfurovum sp.]